MTERTGDPEPRSAQTPGLQSRNDCRREVRAAMHHVAQKFIDDIPGAC